MNKFLTGAFLIGGIVASGVAISPASYASTQKCVDGTVKSNIVSTINNGTITVTTKDSKPLCKAETLYWSSYTMPDNYDGLTFAASKTAAPQTMYDNAVISMKAGATKATATIKLPSCKNVQTDLYYGPEVKNVTAAGHGKQFIDGQINGFATSYTGSRSKDLSACQTPVTTTPTTPTTTTPTTTTTTTTTTPTPVTTTTETSTPETPATTTTTETPAVETPAPVTELASTGIRENVIVAVAVALAAGAYGVTMFIMKKKNA